MINFRLRQAGCRKSDALFDGEAVKLIYEYSQGYPRKVSMICHDAIEAL
jgi:type II secretory pathway predicted ATPase ExeA